MTMMRVCPMRDAICPHGMDCPYSDGYNCKPGYMTPASSPSEHPAMSSAPMTTVPEELKPWPNNCQESVPAALRYLADHARPIGGEEPYNSAHLLQLAEEIERAFRAPHPAPIDGRGEAWRSMASAPQDGTRILLAWEPFAGLSEHVELGKWKTRYGWCNTYGNPFEGEPSAWAPLAPFTHPAPAPGPAEWKPGDTVTITVDGIFAHEPKIHGPADAVSEAEVLLGEAREILDAIAGYNVPDRSWASDVRDRILVFEAAQRARK